MIQLKNMRPFRKIEKKWRQRWLKEKTYEVNLKRAKRPFYNLMMFPYPSAAGLHVGNMYAFTGSDIYGRFQRMKGKDVFEPIGLDGFGIHSENYALKIGAHPMKQAKVSEERFYRQLTMIGNGFQWSSRLETYDPQYYRWTQWIFLQLFKQGLAYRQKAPVNWCPSCKTVLADEQVTDGACERCDNQVIKKELEQWFFRITAYAEKLLKNLDKIDWSEKVKANQRNWIGRSEGFQIEFKIKNSKLKIPVFTTRPDTLFGATYLVLSPEHELIKNSQLKIENHQEVKKYINQARKKTDQERAAVVKDKTGVELKGIKVINPANQKELPVWVADYVLTSYGTGAIMAVPAHDQRDFEFARKYKLPIYQVITPDRLNIKSFKIKEVYEDEGILINSGQFNDLDSKKAKEDVAKFVKAKKKNQYHLRDWLISRQRYWGPPIPIIYCRKCWEVLNSKSKVRNKFKIQNPKLKKIKEGIDYAIFDGKEYIIHPAPEKDLPIKLPFVKNFQPKGRGTSPLAAVKSFYKVKCPKCGYGARRETDVSDTFLDSAWYYIGYLLLAGNSKFKIQNSKFQALVRRWLPVDMYIGGVEHSVLHLLYARFIAMALKDIKFIDFEEPFSVFWAHGLIIKEGAKMSKSKGNIVNPDEYIEKFGADALRLHLMFIGPFEEGGDFRDQAIVGVVRFLNRVWRLGLLFSESFSKNTVSASKKAPSKKNRLADRLHPHIKKISEDVANLRYNTAIAELMIILNNFEKNPRQVIKEEWEVFLKLLAPFAPFVSEELWEKLGHKNSLHLAAWPEYDEKLIQRKTIEFVAQVNGRVRDKFEIRSGADEESIRLQTFEREKIKRLITGKKIKKVIFVSGKLINIVTD